MGCFFGCFKVRDDRHRPRTYLGSDPSCSKNREAVLSRNQLASLFLSEENEDSPSKDTNASSLGSPRYTKELKDEAKFLKACGTIVETPTEIRKASKRFLGSPQDERDFETSKYQPWVPNPSVKSDILDNHPNLPHTPAKHTEEWGKESNSLEHTPSSCTTTEEKVQRFSSYPTGSSKTDSVITAADFHGSPPSDITSKAPPSHLATDIQCRSKSVRFECDINESPDGSSLRNMREKTKDSDLSGNLSASRPSPYPTPIQLSDEMQTPGTVFPANLGVLPNEKARIRSQYVYSVLNPVESAAHLKALKEEDSYPEGFSGELRHLIEQPGNSTPKSEFDVKDSTQEDLMVEASLSAWLKPVSNNDDGSKNYGAVHRPNRFGRSAGDRPIIGMVAAHWNDEEPSQISPKEWDGNGIPNSTNKYKEDQKVSWHATPFEERLEKALSEESIITRKNFEGKLVSFDEEDDTALSRLQSSIQPSSVVSF